MENMKLEDCEPVVYIKEELANINALNPIDLNIQDEEDITGDKSEHKVYCSLTVVNPEEITYDSVGSDDYNSDWVFGVQNSESSQPLNDKTVESSHCLEYCDLSNDSTFSRLDNEGSDNSNMTYTYYSLPPNDVPPLVSFTFQETAPSSLPTVTTTTFTTSPAFKRVDVNEWNNITSEQKKVFTRTERTPPVKKTFPCPICNKIFATKSRLERHGVVHSNVKPFQCVECKRMFSRRVHLERHKFLHMDEKPFNCDICKKGFTQKTHLEKHKYVHTGIKPFECDLCKKPFARKESLNRHKILHATGKIKIPVFETNTLNTNAGDKSNTVNGNIKDSAAPVTNLASISNTISKVKTESEGNNSIKIKAEPENNATVAVKTEGGSYNSIKIKAEGDNESSNKKLVQKTDFVVNSEKNNDIKIEDIKQEVMTCSDEQMDN